MVHCLVQRRADGLGSNHNAKLFAIGAQRRRHQPRQPRRQLLPEFGPEPTDLVLHRWHGLGPMGGTDLDAILRNLGVHTIVAVGVSLNVAITNLVMDAVNAATAWCYPGTRWPGFRPTTATRDHRQHAVTAGHRSPPPTI